VKATCRTNSDCQAGLRCVKTTQGARSPDCTASYPFVTTYACQMAVDDCRDDADCAGLNPGDRCLVDGVQRVCGNVCLPTP